MLNRILASLSPFPAIPRKSGVVIEACARWFSRPLKVVGVRTQGVSGPGDSLRRAEQLIAAADRLAPHPKPRGFVVKSKTWQEYAAWKRAQANPWLW